MTVKELIEFLNQYYKPDDVIVAPIWDVNDIIHYAGEQGIGIYKDEAEKILRLIDRHSDCDLGISWTTVKCAIDEYLEERGDDEQRD